MASEAGATEALEGAVELVTGALVFHGVLMSALGLLTNSTTLSTVSADRRRSGLSTLLELRSTRSRQRTSYTDETLMLVSF
jgi:hypothetical protein